MQEGCRLLTVISVTPDKQFQKYKARSKTGARLLLFGVVFLFA